MSADTDIIAQLREEKRVAVEAAEYWEKQHEHERAQRQKEIGMQEYRGNTVSYIYDKERNYGAHFDRMNKEIESLKAQLKDMTDQFFAVSGQLGEARGEIERLNALISGPFAITAALHETLAKAGCVSVRKEELARLRAENKALGAVYQVAIKLVYHAKHIRESGSDGKITEITGTTELDAALVAYEKLFAAHLAQSGSPTPKKENAP